ncbi:MAG: hypothetical protein AAF750_02565 [Planctomycetota bacterium]
MSAAGQEAGDAVEVREGDVWSPATVVKREGRRIQIRYSDGTEEWIGKDRMRLPGQQAGGGGGATDTVAPPPKPAAAPPRRFRMREAIEYKRGGFWRDGVIKRISQDLYLVGEPGARSDFHSRWMLADTIRRPGEAHAGPDAFNQFSHAVHNESVRDSLREARKALKEFRTEQSQKAVDDEGRDDPFGALPFSHPVTPVNVSGMQEIATRVGTGEPVQADPDPAAVTRPWSARFTLGTGEFFEKVSGVSVSGGHLLIGLEDSPPGGAIHTSAARISAATGRVSRSAPFEAATIPVDISFDGNLVAAIGNAKSNTNKTRVDLWDWSTAMPRHLVSFKAATGEGIDNVTDVRFTRDGLVVVARADGWVTAYAVASGTVNAVWRIELSRSLQMIRSPGGGQLAIAAGGEVLLLDAATGQPLLVRSSLGVYPRYLSFSPNGRYLAIAGRGVLTRWDLTTDQLTPTVAIKPGAGMRAVLATDAGQVYDGQHLIDPETGAAVWTYTREQGIRDWSTSNGVLLGIQKGSRSNATSRTISAWPLPHRPAANAAIPPVTNLVARGGAITLDLGGLEGSAADKRKLEAALTAHFAEAGVSIEPNQPTRLVGKTTTDTRTEQFRDPRRSPFGPTQSANVTNKTTTLSLEHEGETLWQRASTSGMLGFMVHMQQGESLQAALDRQAQVDLSSMSRVSFPQIVPAPHDATGSTALRPGGFAR